MTYLFTQAQWTPIEEDDGIFRQQLWAGVSEPGKSGINSVFLCGIVGEFEHGDAVDGVRWRQTILGDARGRCETITEAAAQLIRHFNEGIERHATSHSLTITGPYKIDPAFAQEIT